jgi:hypothetical protein
VTVASVGARIFPLPEDTLEIKKIKRCKIPYYIYLNGKRNASRKIKKE